MHTAESFCFSPWEVRQGMGWGEGQRGEGRRRGRRGEERTEEEEEETEDGEGRCREIDCPHPSAPRVQGRTTRSTRSSSAGAGCPARHGHAQPCHRAARAAALKRESPCCPIHLHVISQAGRSSTSTPGLIQLQIISLVALTASLLQAGRSDCPCSRLRSPPTPSWPCPPTPTRSACSHCPTEEMTCR